VPNRDFSDAATVGTNASLPGEPRIMQLSLRVQF